MRHAILPIFFFITLICGGTSQYAPQLKIFPYTVSLFILGICLLPKFNNKLSEPDHAKHIWRMIFIIMIALALQLIWVPPNIWAMLPGRGIIVQAYSLANIHPPWLPASLTPEKSLFSILDFLPPLAVYLYMTRVATEKEIKSNIKLLIGTATLTVIYGLVQVLTKSKGLYLYETTNLGRPTAFFSNTNHFATFLLMTLPFSLNLITNRVSSGWSSILSVSLRNRSSLGVLLISVMIIAGVISTQSLAGIGIMAIVVSTFYMIITRLNLINRTKSVSTFTIGVIIISIATFLAFDILLSGSLTQDAINTLTHESEYSRRKVYPQVIAQILTYFPVGAGLGSFEETFLLQQQTSEAFSIFVNHAHNDYLELLLEYGIWGIVFVSIFVHWWLQAWKDLLPTAGKFYGQFNALRMPAMLAIGVVLIHSFVDYPMRTISISSYLAFCVGIVCRPLPKRTASKISSTH